MLSSSPLHLGEAKSVDPFTLEPGAILWDRFCVVSSVHQTVAGWSIWVVDIDRKLGRAPHHKLVLEQLRLSSSDRRHKQRAFAAESTVQPRVHAMAETREGDLVVVHEWAPGEPLPSVISRQRALEIAAALALLLADLHREGVTGIQFLRQQIHVMGRDVHVDGFAHLHGAGDQHSDITDLLALFRELHDDLVAVSSPAPSTARELWQRICALDGSSPVVFHLPPHPPFVGRDEPLEQIHAALGRARVAVPSAVAVRGIRGIGKTRLLHQFTDECDAQSPKRAIVLRGRYEKDAGERSIGLITALNQLGRLVRTGELDSGQLSQRLRAHTRGFGRLLARFAPGLGPLIGESPEPPEIELRQRYIRHVTAIADALRAVGTHDRPLVLVLDNIDYADAGSLAVLHELLSVSKPHHTLLLVSTKEHVPSELPDASSASITLRGLERDDLRTLLRESLGSNIEKESEAVETLFTETGGHPLAAWAALQAWVERDVLQRESPDGHWYFDPLRDTTTGIHDLFVYRMLRASPDQCWLALLTALRSNRADPHWLASVVDWTSDRLHDALSGLQQSGLMLTESDGKLHFSHDTVRDIVVQSFAPEEVRRAHWQIAHWLAQPGRKASPDQLAFHAELGGGDTLVDLRSSHQQAGVELLEVYDLERAEWHFRHALQRSTSTDQRIAALEGVADVAALGHRTRDAAKAYQEALDLCEDRTKIPRIATKATRALYVRSSSDLARSVGFDALRKVGHAPPSSGLGKIFALLHAFVASRFRPSEPPEVRDALCTLYPWLIGGLLVQEPLMVATFVYRAKRLAEGLHTDTSMALTFHGALLGTLGRYDAANRALDDAECVAARTDSQWGLGVVKHIRGHIVELPAGKYHAGQRSLDQAIEHFRNTGDLSIAAASLFFKAAYARDREPSSIVLDWLDEATTMARRHGNDLSLAQITALRLLLQARRGDDGVRERAHGLADQIIEHGTVAHDRLATHVYLSLIFLQTEELDAARSQADLADALMAELPGVPEICQEIHYAQCMVLLAEPRLDRPQRSQLRRARKKLHKAGKHSPRLHAAWLHVSMLSAKHSGRLDQAVGFASDLLSSMEHHGQTYLVLETHRALADLKRADQPWIALAHDRTYRELCTSLGIMSTHPLPRRAMMLSDPARMPASRRPAPPSASSLTPHTTEGLPDHAPRADRPITLEKVFKRVRPMVERLASSMEFVFLRAPAGLEVRAPERAIESLLVNMACNARDAAPSGRRLMIQASQVTLDEQRAAELPGASAGDYVAIAARATPGPTAAMVSGLVGLRRIAGHLGGFLQRQSTEDGGVEITVLLPLESGSSTPHQSRGSAVVIHPNTLVRHTLVATLSQLGYECTHGTPQETAHTEPPAHAVVFAEPDTASILRSCSSAKIVDILQRGDRHPADTPSVSVPFVIGELDALLEQLNPSSNGTAQRTE